VYSFAAVACVPEEISRGVAIALGAPVGVLLGTSMVIAEHFAEDRRARAVLMAALFACIAITAVLLYLPIVFDERFATEPARERKKPGRIRDTPVGEYTLRHTVTYDDTLQTIAEMYGFDVEYIKAANPGIRWDEDLDVGMDLVIPF
jgi:hypothetical protein